MARSVYSAFVLFLLVALATAGYGQGSTTSSLTGVVVDGAGPIIGATVKATHVPTGTISGGITNSSGRFSLINLRAGGPYTLEVSYIGYQTYTKEDIRLTLGQTLDLSVALVEEGVTTEEIVISAGKGDIFDGKRTGTETNISSQQIRTLPTINRSLGDITRLTPQATVEGNGAISIAGSNNRYNNISIDGAVSNDVFGLGATGTPGGQTNSRNGTQTAQPISLDAIEELQIVIAPYDVRQGGFTGGGINAVTRSGSNEFSGSVYGFIREKGLTGKLNRTRSDGSPFIRQFDGPFSYYQTGFRLGGYIVKNKLFFFVNAEITESEEPRFLLPGDPSRATLNDEEGVQSLQEFVNVLSVTWPTIDPNIAPFTDVNGFKAYTNKFTNQKFLAKLDWNIDDNHRLSFRHSYVRSRKQEAPSNSSTSFSFAGTGQDFVSVTNSTVAELNSTFGSKISNKARLVVQFINDDRDPLGDPYPNIVFQAGQFAGAGVTMGSEPFSMINLLNQTNLAFTNDFSLFSGKHTFTFGTHNEYFRFENRFIRNAFGSYFVTDSASFAANRTISSNNYRVSYVNPSLGLPDDWGPEFGAFQFGIYAQDEWAVSKRLNLVIGIRADLPVFPDKPGDNPVFNENPLFDTLGVATNRLPKSRVLLAPRVGFTYDVLGTKELQLRGGFGLFTGRVPFVWISNQFGNTGIELVRFENIGSNGLVPFRNIPGQPRLGAFTIEQFNEYNSGVSGFTPLNPNTTEINVTSDDFRFPQVFRTNLGVDYKLPVGGLIATVDFLFTRTLNNIHYTDLNIGGPTGRYTTFTGTASGRTFNLVDNRPVYFSRRDPGNFTNVILLSNTSRGYGYNGTIQLQRPFDNTFGASVAYTFGRSTSVNDGTSAQAISNWRFTPNVTGVNQLNEEPSTTSNFQVDHRVVASVTGSFKWGQRFRTTLTLFYQSQSGQPFSYLYRNPMNGDANGDDVGGNENDLIFIPADATQINLVVASDNNSRPWSVQEQWDALNAFIESDPYLRKHRGQYMERNGARTPWQHQLDFSLRQDIEVTVVGKPHTVQFLLDIFNVANLLNEEWGRDFFVSNNSYQLIDFVGIDSAGFPSFSAIPQTGDNNGTVPLDNEPWNSSSSGSIWQMQLGLRYSF